MFTNTLEIFFNCLEKFYDREKIPSHKEEDYIQNKLLSFEFDDILGMRHNPDSLKTLFLIEIRPFYLSVALLDLLNYQPGIDIVDK